MTAQEAADYFNRVAFLFVPNACNARCEFCYVEPAYAEHAHLPTEMLARGASLFGALAEWGFEEVRVTGGEPLIFDNATDLFNQISEAGLQYRLLTNGLALQRFSARLRDNPPRQFTVSVHNLERIAEIYGVPVDVDAFAGALMDAATIAPVECTLVIQPGDDVVALRRTLGRLHDCHVSGIKLILANVEGSKDQRLHFDTVAGELRSEWIGLFEALRVSDVADQTCHLLAKGFLSIDLASMSAYSCCVQVGSAPLALGEHYSELGRENHLRIDAGQDSGRLVGLAKAGRASIGLPCNAHYGACPIALRS